MREIPFLFFSFIVIVMSAQDVKINWGPEYKKEDGFVSFIRYAGHTSNAYYVVSQNLKSSGTILYDFNHKLLGNQPANYKYGKSDIVFSEVLKTTSGNYFIFGGFDKAENKGLLLYTTASANSKINANYTKILEYPFDFKKPFGLAGFSFNSNFDSDKGGVITSQDSTKVLFVLSQGLQDTKAKQVISYVVLDDKLKPLYVFDKSLNYADNKFDVIGNTVFNNSSVFFLGKLYENDKDRKTPNFKFYLLNCTSENGVQEVQITLKDAAPLNGRIVDMENGNVMIVGAYTNLSNINSLRANGTYSIVLNEEGSILANHKYPFSGEVKEELFGENEAKADRGAVNYKVRNVILNKQTKDVTICFEKFYVNKKTTKTTKNPFGNSMTSAAYTTESTTYFYHTDDIIVTGFDSTGDRKFETIIDKKFSYTDSHEPTSFSFCEHNGFYYFLFNDAKTISEKNESNVKGKIVTDLVKMDATGKIISRNTLFGNKDIDMLFIPVLSEYIENGKWLVHARMAKKYKYGTILLE